MNELFGFVMRCSTQSAAHLTDYVINRGTAIQMAGGMSRANELLQLAVFSGYMVEESLEEDGHSRKVYRILDDPDFIHLRTKAEIDWERQRRNDTARPELVIPARLRDGDGCRYCGKVVRWGAQNGRLGGTYDHRIPGKQAASEKDLFVACRGCNAGRKDNPNADQDYPRLPAPETAYFSASTIQWLREHEYVKRMGMTVPEPSGKQLQPGDETGNDPKPPSKLSALVAALAAGDGSSGQHEGNGTPGPTTTGNGPTGQHEGDGVPGPTTEGNGSTGPTTKGDGTPGPATAGNGPTGQHEDHQHSPGCQHIANPAKRLTDGTGIAGTGRVGTGRAGTGREPSPPPQLSQPPRNGNKKSRRGRPHTRGRN
ncbi:UNVERIFIED_ORG: 5-methylcytosine-specific restriction endonuclease McrA [Arthrobacter sp. UYEF1]